MVKKTLLSVLLSILFIPTFAFAYSDYLVLGGDNIGIELKSKGVVVVGFYKVNDDYIAKEAGLQVGDVITTINDTSINSILDLTKTISSSDGNIKIGYVRNNMSKFTDLKLSKENNNFKTGLYVKDSITGIGTLTYIDPNTKLYGALGHEIIDSKTGRIFEVSKGKIYESNVTDIEPSLNGVPGEKNAKVLSNNIEGDVFENTNKGIFGNYTGQIDDSKLYKVATPNDIKKGSAYIYTVLEGNKIEKFEIKITKLSDSKDTKNILFEIVDEELLKKTNGIVQGMSGSPIVQGDYIIGAVTHVVVDNPRKGYGIFITNMLEESEN